MVTGPCLLVKRIERSVLELLDIGSGSPVSGEILHSVVSVEVDVAFEAGLVDLSLFRNVRAVDCVLLLLVRM